MRRWKGVDGDVKMKCQDVIDKRWPLVGRLVLSECRLAVVWLTMESVHVK